MRIRARLEKLEASAKAPEFEVWLRAVPGDHVLADTPMGSFRRVTDGQVLSPAGFEDYCWQSDKYIICLALSLEAVEERELEAVET